MVWFKRAFWLLGVVVAVAALIWFVWPRPVPVDLATTTLGPMQVTIDEEARTNLRHVYTVTAPVTGIALRIANPDGAPAEMSVHVGDRVIAGDPSAVFYGNDYINHPDHRAAAEAAIYAVFPSACTRPIFPELLAEGLEPHQVKEVYVSGDDRDANTFVDISATLDRKIESLRCHKSQVDPGDGSWVRQWAAETGKRGGLEHAEAFRVMRLVPEEPAEGA